MSQIPPIPPGFQLEIPRFDPTQPFTIEGGAKTPDIFDRLAAQKTNAPIGDIFDQLTSLQKSAVPVPKFDPSQPFTVEGTNALPPIPAGYVLESPRLLSDGEVGFPPQANPAPTNPPYRINRNASQGARDILRNQFVDTRAGGKPVSFGETPVTEVVGGVLADAAKLPAQVLGGVGNVARASVADLAQAVEYPEGGSNLQALYKGEPLPIDEAAQVASEDAKARGDFPAAATVAGVSQGLTKTAPKIMALPLAGEGLLAQSIAAGGIFGVRDDGSFSPKDAVIGALMPGVGKVARIGVASALANGIESGSTRLSNPLAQKLIEGMGEQAALDAYQIAASSPELIQQYKTDPNAAYATVADIVGSNLAFGLLGVPGLHPDAPSGTELFLADHANKYSKAADDMIRQRIERESPTDNPAFQNTLNRAAVQNLNPDWNATLAASRLPEPQEPQNFVGPNMMDALDQLAVDVAQPRVPSTAGIPLDRPTLDLSQPIADESAASSVPAAFAESGIENSPAQEPIASPVDSLIERNRRRLAYEQQVANKPAPPVVPETVESQPRESAVQTARRLGLNTIEKIRAQWPEAQISREQAREIRNLAFPETAQPKQRVLLSTGEAQTIQAPAKSRVLISTKLQTAERAPVRPSYRPAQRPQTRLAIGSEAETPISEAQARQAVHDVIGSVPANVRFINEAKAPAGRITMKPGELPQIELNLARHNSPKAVSDTLHEELIHNVWQAPELSDARRIIEPLVTAESIRQKQAVGYSAEIAPEEAANEIVRRLYRQHAESSIFRRALNQVVLAVKRAFGITLNDREAAMVVTRAALRNGPSAVSGVRQAIQPFKNRKSVDQMAEAVGVEDEGKEHIRELASAQVGAFPRKAAEAISYRMQTTPENLSEVIQQRFLRPIARMIEISDTPKDVRTIDNSDLRAAASYAVVGQHFLIGDQRAKIVEAFNQAEADIAKDIEDMKGMPALEAKTRMLHALSNDLPAAYERYLKSVIATSGPYTTMSATARELIRRAQIYAGDAVVPPGSVQRAIESLVDNERIITAGVDAKGILAQIWSKGGKTGVSPEQSLLLFGNPDGTGVNGLIPLLARVRNLPAIIEALRGIKSNSVEALKQIEAFKSNFSNSGKAVGITTAMKRYAKIVMASRDADTVLSTLNKKYAKDRSRLLGAEEALRHVDAVLQSDAYQQSVASAADALGVTISDIFNEAGGEVRLKGPISGRDYIISRVPTKETELENRRQAERLLAEIGTLVNDPNADPIKKRTWNSIGERVGATWLESISSPMESKVYPLDVKSLMPWLRNQQGVFEQIGGRLALDTRRMFQAVDSIGDLIAREERNENFGLAKHSVLTSEAMKSHDMNPRNPHDVQRYERGIANVILGSLQHPGQIKLSVGQYIPFTNHIVTAEDMALINAQHALEQAVRKHSEHDIEQYGIPSRVLDQVGGTKFRRTSVPVGSKTVSRIAYDWSRDFVINNWRVGLEPEARAKQLSDLMASIENDADLWRDFVLGYVRESDPTFPRGAEFDNEFRQLTARARENPTVLDSFDDLTEALAPDRAEGRDALRARLRTFIASEIGSFLDRFASKVDSESKLRDVDAVTRAVFSSLQTEGSFLQPRGPMLVPGSLYQYAKISSRDIAKPAAIAKNIARARAIEGMNQVLSALTKFQGKLEEDLARMESSVSSPKTRSEAMNIQANQKRMGEIRFTLPEVKRRINAVRSEIKKAENTLQNWDVDLSPTMSQTASLVNKGSTLQLLGSVGSVFNNLVGGIGLNDLITSAYMRNWKQIIFSPAVMTATAFKTGIGDVINLAQKTNPRVASALKNMLPFTNALADLAQETAELNQRLGRSGIMTPFDWANRRAAKRFVGNGGDVVTEGDEMPLHLRLMKNVYTSAPLLFQEAVFPRKFDNFINTVQAMRLEYYLKDLASRAMDIGDVRAASGKEPNPLDATQRIAPDELQMNERQMHWLRSTLEMSGTTLERMMFDYWKRLKSAPESERPNIPLISDSLVAEAVLRAFSQTGNVIRESNSISSSRGSAARRIIFTLGSYSSNLLDQLVKVMPTYSETGFGKQAANLALFAVTASALGITAFELRRRLVEAFTGKTSGQPSLANVAEHPLSSDAQTYLLNALSNEIPYLGLATQHLFDTGTGRSIFDLADMVPLAGLFRDSGEAIEKAIKTGSVALPLEDSISRRAPLYSSVLNRVPPLSGAILSGEATRALRAATPRAMQKPAGGYTSNVGSKSTRLLRSAQAAELQADDRTASNLIKQAVQQRMAERPGISQAQATSQLRSSIAARNPATQVFGRKLKATELSATLDRMTSQQQGAFNRGRKANQTLMSLLPHAASAKSTGIFKSHAPIFKSQRKLRSLQAV